MHLLQNLLQAQVLVLKHPPQVLLVGVEEVNLQQEELEEEQVVDQEVVSPEEVVDRTQEVNLQQEEREVALVLEEEVVQELDQVEVVVQQEGHLLVQVGAIQEEVEVNVT